MRRLSLSHRHMEKARVLYILAVQSELNPHQIPCFNSFNFLHLYPCPHLPLQLSQSITLFDRLQEPTFLERSPKLNSAVSGKQNTTNMYPRAQSPA